ncbi:MAG: hypothetical protein A2992_07950 [Elusimicrobia bacterium RIFCSPLOWO2_01_FULL_59_12]|nr:MAG: hypothetical protein A2992_07950 [Elusimicrobia bacterium RIFCSPLOWO2_01_FULL_59_12]
MSGLTVLTEAATGHYSLTASIAALAHAKNVYALTAESRFGTAQEAARQTTALADAWGVSGNVHILSSREDPRLHEVDLVTNLGFVRPINRALLGRLKPGVSIALMWEPWEFRESDLDLAACRELNIPVLGTQESHPALQLFDYVGLVAMKLLFELEIEVFRSRLIVVGQGVLAEKTLAVLTRNGAHATVLSGRPPETLSSGKAQDAFRQADAAVIVEHHLKESLIGPDGQITAFQLKDLNPGLSIAHICGAVDASQIETAQIPLAPRPIAPAGYMSVLTNYVGPKPLIDLHAAGLKVGSGLARERQAGHAGAAAEERVLRTLDLAVGFGSAVGGKR